RHGEARDVVSGHPARGRRPLDRAGGRLPDLRRVLDDHRRGAERLDRSPRRDPGVAHGHPARGRGHRSDVLGDRSGGLANVVSTNFVAAYIWATEAADWLTS